MAQTKKRQASSLTLAANKREAEALILRALSAKSSGNYSGRLPARLPEALPARLPALPMTAADDALGRPLGLRQVAILIGCSPWTVRQKLLSRGLPYFRSGASGKLIFYEAQIVRWIEKQQGGKQK